MKKYIAILSLALLAGCVAGGMRPTVWSSPQAVLKSFPLGTMTEQDMLTKVGPPEETVTIGGRKAFIYRLGRDMGARSYTYIFGDDGKVADVVFNDNGYNNGKSARQLQGK